MFDSKSFQIRFEKELKKMGWNISYAGEKTTPDLVFVVGGIRKLLSLTLIKLRGIPVIYRLDGNNWTQRRNYAGLRKSILSEFRNSINKFIKAFLADKIIYQSKFIEMCLKNKGWCQSTDSEVIFKCVT